MIICPGQGPPLELWEILAAGAVPVYWGAPGLDRWLPEPLAAVNAADFGSPLALAGYLQDISTNQDALLDFDSTMLYHIILSQIILYCII